MGFNEALQVRYKDEPIMVGKIFLMDGSLVFLHEQSGTQKHWSTDCTSPVDVRVIEYLIKLGVPTIHAAHEGSKQMLMATPQLIAEQGQRLGYDQRDRYYLPDPFWTIVERDYEIPYCPREHLIECKLFELPPLIRPRCVVCNNALSPVVNEKYTGVPPECGGMLSTIHVGFTRNSVTCRYQDDGDRAWNAARDQINERAKKR